MASIRSSPVPHTLDFTGDESTNRSRTGRLEGARTLGERRAVHPLRNRQLQVHAIELLENVLDFVRELLGRRPIAGF
jgi:hypothetical protein